MHCGNYRTEELRHLFHPADPPRNEGKEGDENPRAIFLPEHQLEPFPIQILFFEDQEVFLRRHHKCVRWHSIQEYK